MAAAMALTTAGTAGRCSSFYARMLLKSTTYRCCIFRSRSRSTNGRATELRNRYAHLRYEVEKTDPPAWPLSGDLNPKAVFANNELDLDEVEVFGFDYDYTLASYKEFLHETIYMMGRESLIERFKYPADLKDAPYDKHFAIRGLHFDVKKGLLMKVDSFMNIQLGSVYRGLGRVGDEEIKSLYKGTQLPASDFSFYGTGTMHQLMDNFALPEITLLASTVEYFIKNNIPYDPECVFNDVQNVVQGLHESSQIHQEIMNNIDRYLERNYDLRKLLEKLNTKGKKLFLITNSGISFVDKGMTYMLGADWVELFDVVVVNARKPKFFTEESRPFRKFHKDRATLSWERVNTLEKGHIYFQGNLSRLQQKTGWYGSRVLYFGDHVYSDLMDASLKQGWRTGAIIPELEREIRIQNSVVYKEATRWQVALHNLIEEMQINEDEESERIIEEWIEEQNELKDFKKRVFNPRFGSLFRTFHNPTYFTRRLIRFADVYTSSVENLLSYSLKHTFYPRRTPLPHEGDY